MKKPRILRVREICRTPYFEITRVLADIGGRRKTYYLSDHGERAGVLVVRKGAVLLVSQYRFLAGRVCWEIPGGAIEEGEKPAEAASRECREEAGVECLALDPLLTYMPGTDTLANRTHLFLATKIRESSMPEGDEIERRRWVPLDRCLDWARRGTLEDGLTITALLAYRTFGTAGRGSGRAKLRKR